MLKIMTTILASAILIASCSSIMMSKEEKCKKADEIVRMAVSAENTNPELSIKHTLNAIELCPSAPTYAYLATLYMNNKTRNPEEAMKYADIALHEQPYNPFVLDRVAICYFGMAKYNDAMMLLGRSLNIQPNNPFDRFLLAEGYIIQRDFKKGEDELLKSIENSPNFELAYYTLGKLYMDEMTDFKKSHEYLSKYITLAKAVSTPMYFDAKKRIATLETKMPELKSNTY